METRDLDDVTPEDESNHQIARQLLDGVDVALRVGDIAEAAGLTRRLSLLLGRWQFRQELRS